MGGGGGGVETKERMIGGGSQKIIHIDGGMVYLAFNDDNRDSPWPTSVYISKPLKYIYYYYTSREGS